MKPAQPKFALTGVSGFVAPRHLDAIKHVGGDLVAALDPHDAAGVLDRYFPHAYFHLSPERFWRFLDERYQPDFVSICAPNHLHVDQIYQAHGLGATVICEKPLSTTHWDLDRVLDLVNVVPVLQLRYAPSIKALLSEVLASGKRRQVVALYNAPRGNWYERSWKSSIEKSGGLAVNIGVHLFDILLYLFGGMEKRPVAFEHSNRIISGRLELARADVFFRLSIDPFETARRELRLEDRIFPLQVGGDLHRSVYEHAVKGEGLSVAEAEPGLRLALDLSVMKGRGYTAGESSIFEAALKNPLQVTP